MNHPFTCWAHLGIDISKLSFEACLWLNNTLRSATFPNNPEGFTQLDAWLKEHDVPKTFAGLEATGPYGAALLWHLHVQGHRVHLLNPRRVKDYGRSQGRRVKTDRSDAALIATYLRASEKLQPWQPPTQALVELQA